MESSSKKYVDTIKITRDVGYWLVHGIDGHWCKVYYEIMSVVEELLSNMEVAP